MGSWWRSEEMSYVSIIFSEEAATACIRELGTLGCIQFTDLNPELTPFQRRYVAFIKRCDEIERRIRYVHGEVKRMGVPEQPYEPADTDEGEGATGSQLLEFLETRLEQYEQQLVELNKYSSKIAEEYGHKVCSSAPLLLCIYSSASTPLHLLLYSSAPLPLRSSAPLTL
jgi:V-type H+-transporting ATPase subunit a